MNKNDLVAGISTLVIACLALALPHFTADKQGQNASPNQEPPSENLRFQNLEHDFGEIDEGQNVSHDFVFTNVGSQPITVTDVKSSCGCSVPDWVKDPIAPGESGHVSVIFHSANRSGKQSKRLTVFSAEPDKRETQLTITALVNNPVLMEPAYLIMKADDAFQGGELTSQAKITLSDEVDHLSLQGQEGDFFTASLVEKGPKEYELQIAGQIPENEHFLDGKIFLDYQGQKSGTKEAVVRFYKPQNQATTRLSSQVLKVNPPVLFFKKGQTEGQVTVLLPEGVNAVDIAQADGDFYTATLQKNSEGQYQLTATLKNPSDQTNDKARAGKIKLKYSGDQSGTQDVWVREIKTTGSFPEGS